MRLLATVLTIILPFSALAGTLDEKPPAYFVDRYGPAVYSKPTSSDSFINVGRGGVLVKGPFSVREYRKGDLMVHTVHFLPSLRLASVTLHLPRQWTNEQIEAALASYGGAWKPVSARGIINYWVAPDGAVAISLLNLLQIQSKVIVDQILKSLAEDDAKRKAVPKF
jgi:hypothetical protein